MPRLSESFRRLRERGFAERFYGRFLHAHPHVGPFFRDTDLTRQRELFDHGVLMVLDHHRGGALGHIAVRRLGRLHRSSRVHVPDHLYPVWISTFLDTAAELDPDWSPELALDWHDALSRSVSLMISDE